MAVFAQLKQVMEREGGSWERFSLRDGKFRDAGYSEIEDSWRAWRRFLVIMRLTRYRREGNDCDNFAEAYRVFMQWRYATGEYGEPTGLCDFCIGGDANRLHAINFRVCGASVYFIEPQAVVNPVRYLSEAERATLKWVML